MPANNRFTKFSIKNLHYNLNKKFGMSKYAYYSEVKSILTQHLWLSEEAPLALIKYWKMDVDLSEKYMRDRISMATTRWMGWNLLIKIADADRILAPTNF